MEQKRNPYIPNVSEKENLVNNESLSPGLDVDGDARPFESPTEEGWSKINLFGPEALKFLNVNGVRFGIEEYLNPSGGEAEQFIKDSVDAFNKATSKGIIPEQRPEGDYENLVIRPGTVFKGKEN